MLHRSGLSKDGESEKSWKEDDIGKGEEEKLFSWQGNR